MGNPNYESLRDAIARGSAAVLSLSSAGMVRNQKTRFLGEDENGFWIEADAAERGLIQTLMSDEVPVGVAFKAGYSSVGFVSIIKAHDVAHRVNADLAVEAVFLPFPENFRALQRRQVYRVALPMAHDLGLRAWHVPEHAILRDRPLAAQEIAVRLTSLSVMGIGGIARVGRDGRPPRLLVNERVRVVLTAGTQELLTEGRVIHFRTGAGDAVAFGVQFKKLEKDIEGRQTLSKLTEIVGQQQREEIKRRRAMADAAA